MNMMKLVGLLPVIPLAMLASIFNGYVLSTMWSWFVVPLGIRPVGIMHAIGISWLIRFVCKKYPSKKDDRKDLSPQERVFILLFAPALALNSGWVIHWLMMRP